MTIRYIFIVLFSLFLTVEVYGDRDNRGRGQENRRGGGDRDDWERGDRNRRGNGQNMGRRERRRGDRDDRRRRRCRRRGRCGPGDPQVDELSTFGIVLVAGAIGVGQIAYGRREKDIKLSRNSEKPENNNQE